MGGLLFDPLALDADVALEDVPEDLLFEEVPVVGPAVAPSVIQWVESAAGAYARWQPGANWKAADMQGWRAFGFGYRPQSL